MLRITSLIMLGACGTLPESAAPTAQPVAQPVAPRPLAEMRAAPLSFTQHGRCRMRCRQFDEAEVRHVLATGELQPERTRLDGRCPSHALEGTTPDGQQARMVFAACPGDTRLVTAIDLDRSWPCDCD